MFESAIANVIVYLLSLFGFSGIVAGVVIKFVGRKLDKSDKAAEARQTAMIQCVILSQEGIQVSNDLALAAANVVIREHGTTPELATAMVNLDDYQRRDAAFTRKAAADQIYGKAVHV